MEVLPPFYTSASAVIAISRLKLPKLPFLVTFNQPFTLTNISHPVSSV
jgi:hypothetical protein